MFGIDVEVSEVRSIIFIFTELLSTDCSRPCFINLDLSELLEVLVRGESSIPPDNIRANENAEEAKNFYEQWIARVKAEEVAAAEAYEEALRAQSEYEQEMEEFGDGDTDISTKTGGLNIDPMKQFLFPLQQVS
jgi:hypothetical protein